jgi:hypothetical protein
MNRIYQATLAIVLAALTTASYAGVRASDTKTIIWSATAAGGPRLVYLNNNKDTLITFNLPAAGKKALNYSAACAVLGPSYAYGDLDIYVNDLAAAPTASAGAFCPGGSISGTHTIILAIQGKLGLNTVQIVGRL